MHPCPRASSTSSPRRSEQRFAQRRALRSATARGTAGLVDRSQFAPLWSRLAPLCALPLLLSLVVGPHCRPSYSASPQEDSGSPNEVWLTPEQVRDAKLKLERVEEHNVEDTIVTAGKVAFDDLRVAHVLSPVTGKVTAIRASLGQAVRKGDVLALIESPDLGVASADVRKAEADLAAAEHDFTRKRDLFGQHAVALADVEASEDTYRRAKAELERARNKAALLGNVDQVNQGYALRSPIDGEVVARGINPGIEVQGQYGAGAAVELFTIGKLDQVWVLADIFEMDFARVKLGAHVSLSVVAYPNKTFEGKVDWIAGTLDPATRTAKVRTVLVNDDVEHPLRPEMYATVQIAVVEKRAVAVPRSALVRLGETVVVFVEREPVRTASGERVRFERLPVKVDEAEGDRWVPVERGLDRGMVVVSEGALLLAGMLERRP